MSNKVFLKFYWTYFHVDNLNTFLFQNDKLEIAYEIILAKNLIFDNYKIIDNGCSNGTFLFKINSSYTNYKLNLVGIDINRSAIKSARLFAKKSMINNIEFYTKCNDFESNLIISISTIIYLGNNQLNDFRQSNKILIIAPVSRNKTFI
jgi:ubiquinone/menaquinone biosynthesis C-methylase UbiE